MFSLLWVCVSCSLTEAPKTPYEKIDGKWSLKSVEVLAIVSDGDGSTITFSDCDSPPCQGDAFDADDNKTENFTYEFKEDDVILSITGSAMLGEYDILNFSNTYLKITKPSILGNITYEFIKPE
ncbi:MAG: hypothetical protein GY810_16650 [Aureispira sp.]|nr:hypothetical protein [Aureispira sp.]